MSEGLSSTFMFTVSLNWKERSSLGEERATKDCEQLFVSLWFSKEKSCLCWTPACCCSISGHEYQGWNWNGDLKFVEPSMRNRVNGAFRGLKLKQTKESWRRIMKNQKKLRQGEDADRPDGFMIYKNFVFMKRLRRQTEKLMNCFHFHHQLLLNHILENWKLTVKIAVIIFRAVCCNNSWWFFFCPASPERLDFNIHAGGPPRPATSLGLQSRQDGEEEEGRMMKSVTGVSQGGGETSSTF